MAEPDRWGWWVMQILTPVIVIVGIIGNCLSFAVMKSKALRKKSYSHFLCALAVFDSLTLIFRQITLIHEILTHYNYPGVFDHFDDAACKTFNFTEHMCYLMSSWLIVCMAAERVIAVCLPFKKTIFRTQTGAVVIILSLFVVMSYTQVFRFIMIGKVGDKCEGLEAFIELYIPLHIYVFQFALSFILPFITVLVCNSLVLYQIYAVRKAAGGPSISRTHKTTFMLLTISFTYVIAFLPTVVISSVMYGYVASGSPEAPEMWRKLTPLVHLFAVVSFINYGVNFFIYVLSGRSFRFELTKFFNRERNSSTSVTKTREEILRLM